MDSNVHVGMTGPVTLLVALWMNIMYWVNLNLITFCLSSTATCLAITYYILMIRKINREAKKNNQTP